MLGLGDGYVSLPRSRSTSSPESLGYRLRLKLTSTLRHYSNQPSRLIVVILAVTASCMIVQHLFSSSPSRATIRSASPYPEASLNSGWVTFDDRLDSPFVQRRTTTGPPTGQELRFTPKCRDLWISQAKLCPELRATWRGKGPLANRHTLDVVYTWQNGSDEIQIQERTQAAMDISRGDTGTDAHHFRDHDELRYSLRSLFKAFSRFPEALGRIFIYSSDFAAGGQNSSSHDRIGSIPKWLNVNHPHHGLTKLQFVFPWQAFKTPAFDTVEEAHRWREEALPSFQSMSVESQFANINCDE